jgi:hypothetical protein
VNWFHLCKYKLKAGVASMGSSKGLGAYYMVSHLHLGIVKMGMDGTGNHGQKWFPSATLLFGLFEYR